MSLILSPIRMFSAIPKEQLRLLVSRWNRLGSRHQQRAAAVDSGQKQQNAAAAAARNHMAIAAAAAAAAAGAAAANASKHTGLDVPVNDSLLVQKDKSLQDLLQDACVDRVIITTTATASPSGIVTMSPPQAVARNWSATYP
jgi:hypothetical protein